MKYEKAKKGGTTDSTGYRVFQRKLLSQVIYSWLFFSETPILTIFLAILCQAIMANFSKIAIMAILVWVDVAINMVNMGVSLNS